MTYSRRFVRWAFAHSWLKVLSIGFAVLLWMFVAGEETVERGLRVPLELLQVPDGIELLGDVPTTVDVRARRIRHAGASARRRRRGLDLRTAKSGRRLFPIGPDQVRVPYGVQVVQVTPSAVAMAFEASAARQVPVVPSVDGRPAAGYIVGPMTAGPPAVEVVGPESLVKRVTEVLTEPVTVAGAKEAVKETVSLGVLDPALGLKAARSAVRTVQVVPAPLERTFGNRSVHL